MGDGGIADASISCRVAGARTDDQLGGVLRDEVVEGDLVVAHHGHGGAFEDEVLVDVPGEGVVVVDQDNVAGGGDGRRGLGMAGRVVDDRQRGGHGGRAGVGEAASRRDGRACAEDGVGERVSQRRQPLRVCNVYMVYIALCIYRTAPCGASSRTAWPPAKMPVPVPVPLGPCGDAPQKAFSVHTRATHADARPRPRPPPSTVCSSTCVLDGLPLSVQSTRAPPRRHGPRPVRRPGPRPLLHGRAAAHVGLLRACLSNAPTDWPSTWEIAYSALCDPDTAAKSQPLRDFLAADENLAILASPWAPFPTPSPQEKARFDSATAPISVSPAHDAHYNLDEIKADSLWLSHEAHISEYAALRLAVQEWQTRPAVQLLSGLTEEEVLSVREAAGLTNLGASAFVPNMSILASPTTLDEQSSSHFNSPDQRKLRLIGIYFSTCTSILRVSQMLLAWGAARDLRTTDSTYPSDYRVCDDRFELLGQALADSQNAKDGAASNAPALDRSITAFDQRVEALDEGCRWGLPASIVEDVAAQWILGQTTQIAHILHLTLFHADTQSKDLFSGSSVELWFRTIADRAFFKDFPEVRLPLGSCDSCN